MFFARLKAFTRTLSFRLMAWNAAVVALTAIVTLVGMQVGVRRALVHEIDQFLLDGLNELRQILELTPADALSAGSLRSEGLDVHFGQRSATLATETGQVLWSSDNEMLALPYDAQLADALPTNVANFRIVQQHIPLAGGATLVARVGIPLEVIQADVNRVDRLALTFVAGLLVIAPLVGYWLAGRVLLPLRELIQRTALLRPTRQPDDRLPMRGAGDELDQLAGTVNGLLDRIASYLHHREDFVANAAHELRNPVAAIRSTAEVALGGQRTEQEYEELLEEMIEECARLETLVSQLLLLSESDANRLRFGEQGLDLGEVVRQASATFAPAAESLDIQLQVNVEPVLIDGNPHHLRQVVSNLLDNALKYTGQGGSISVTLSAEGKQGGALLVVEDDGIGIAPDDVPQVFKRFFRGDKSRVRDEHERGAGLGLSICKSIVEAHGGSILVESRLGSGTSFTVRLPKAGAGA